VTALERVSRNCRGRHSRAGGNPVRLSGSPAPFSRGQALRGMTGAQESSNSVHRQTPELSETRSKRPTAHRPPPTAHRPPPTEH
jgi:hypothetical protein